MAILEVIACSVADAIEAERGGASRLEIVRALDGGGLTPPVSLVRGIVSAVSIPVRVMLRENPGFEAGSEAEVKKLCHAAREFAALGVNGLVLGFVRGRQLDLILLSPTRVRGLQVLVDIAAPELTIVAGGGMDADAIRVLLKATDIREFHVGRAARHHADIRQPVDAARVRELAALVAR